MYSSNRNVMAEKFDSPDKKFVVLEDGKQVTVPTADEAEARKQADARKKLHESEGHSAKDITVKRVLHG